jgi:hypothetical protein
MVDENNKSSSDLQWEQFSELVPERDDVKLPEDDIEGLDGEFGRGGITHNMKMTPKLSDAQTFDKRLFPSSGFDWLDRLQVSEIFPDTYNHMFRIFTKDLMRSEKGMSLGEAIATVHTSCSIALTREGRIDVLALSGSLQANAEADKTKGIGI